MAGGSEARKDSGIVSDDLRERDEIRAERQRERSRIGICAEQCGTSERERECDASEQSPARVPAKSSFSGEAQFD